MTNSQGSNIPPEIKKLGRYLKRLRKELGLSIHTVAKKSNLTAGYISKIETGNIFKSINVKTLISFSKIYKIPITSLLEETGFLNKRKDGLPDFAAYLRVKYHLPPQAIRDMEIAKEIIEKKYK